MKKKLTFMFVALITVAAFAIQSKRAASALIDYPTSQSGITLYTLGTDGGVKFSEVAVKGTNVSAIEFGKSLKNTETEKYYAELSVEGGFKAGDIITINGCYSNKDTKETAIVFYKADLSTKLWTTDQFPNVNDGTTDVLEQSYTLTEDVEKIYCGRSGGTKTYLTKLTITREEASGVKYNVTVADGITNGTVKVDKATAAEGDEVTITTTPADGYMLDAISVTCKTIDLAVNVKNGKFTMPADDVTVNATFKVAPVDVTVAAGDITDGDITAAIAAKAAGKPIGNLTLTLAAGDYKVTASMEVGGNVTITGAAGAVIDASALTAPFIKMSSTPAVDKNDKDAYPIDGITIKDVTINKLSQSLVDGKSEIYYLKGITIDNSVINVSGSKHIIDFQGKGLAEVLSIKNSTLWASDDAKHTGRLYQQQSGKKPAEVGAEMLKVSITNSTLYNISNSQNYVGYYRENSKPYHWFEVQNSVIVNCATSGNFVKSLNQKQVGANANWNVDGNIFNYEGVDTSADEVSNSASGVVKNSIAGVITFTDAANGIFNGTLGTETAPTTETTAVGDTEWTITNKQVPANIVISPAEGDITAALATAAEGKIVGNVTINLTADAKYTVSGSIVAGGSVVINGAAGAVIDASALTAPFIALSAEPIAAFLPKNDGSGVTDYYGIDKVDINNVKVTGLKQSIFWDSNKKYCVVDFKIDNCVFALATEAVKNEALIAFQTGGAKDFTVKNSTISGNNAVAKYFLRYNNSSRIDRYGFVQAEDTWSFTYENNTFYGLLNSEGQWGNYSGMVGSSKEKQGILTINNNIWVNCDVQTMRRLNHSKNFSAFNAASTMANNVFNREGAVVDQGTYGNGSDINGIVAFEDATNGDFNGKLTLAPGTTVPATMPGDKSRWTLTPVQTVTTAASGYTTLVSVCPLDFTTAAGLTAYVVAADEDIDITNKKVKLTQVTEAAANTPVILLGAVSTEYTITVKADAAAVTGNLLKGSATTVTMLTDGEAYLLKGGKFGLCAAGELPAGKAYLPAPAGSASNELIIDIDGDVTGIDKVVTRDALENAKIYNLQGQEVKKAGKGIYIINGKKVVMK